MQLAAPGRRDGLALLVEVGLVELGVILPLFRHRILREDRAHRADRLAGAAVDALIWMDEVLIVRVRRVDAVNRADSDSGLVFHADTGFGNYIGHKGETLP